MKRVRVAPGKYVTISKDLAEKAERIFSTSLTRDQVRKLKESVPRRITGVMLGGTKPLALSRPRAAITDKGSTSTNASPASTVATASARRRKVR